MNGLIKQNEEVYYISKPLVVTNALIISFLREQAQNNVRKRCRICTHKDPDELLHEMFIVHHKGNYIPPHAHKNSDESITVLTGEAALFLYEEDGCLIDIIRLSVNNLNDSNYVRVPKGTFHSLYILSDEFLFKEAILGPFKRDNMIESDFAPRENEHDKIASFFNVCQQQLISRNKL